MKKNFFVILCMLCLSGCGRATYSNYEPDDVISEAIADVINSDDIYYQGSSITSEDIIYYEYLIVNEEQGQIEQIATAVNDVLEAGLISEKINIGCRIAMPGGTAWVAYLMNYSNESLEKPDYVALQRLCIGGRHESIYTEPLTYTSLVNIRKLEISSKLQKKAENDNIDWYAYWPDLESVEILSY